MGMMLVLAKQEGKVDGISPYVDLVLKGSRHVSENGRMVGTVIYELRHS